MWFCPESLVSLRLGKGIAHLPPFQPHGSVQEQSPSREEKPGDAGQGKFPEVLCLLLEAGFPTGISEQYHGHSLKKRGKFHHPLVPSGCKHFSLQNPLGWFRPGPSVHTIPSSPFLLSEEHSGQQTTPRESHS